MPSLSKTFIISFLLIWHTSAFLFSQSSDYIQGKIIISGTLEPVPFATIRLKINQIGVYANTDGDFRIIKNPDFRSDSLIITCIGYKRNSIAFNDLDENNVNKIPLAPIVYGLQEVKVVSSGKKLGSPAIIRRAIKNIKDNYPQKSFNYISYYRDYQKHEGNYINLNEAIIQVLDNGFDSLSIRNKYRLLDFRKNNDFNRMNITPYYASLDGAGDSVKYIPEASLGDQYGNELFILLVHDAIRNFRTRSFSFIETFSEDFINNHNFSPPEPVYNNNLLLFKIMFNGKTKIIGNSFLISGAIYIQPRTYAIHKIEYSCSYLEKGNNLGEMFNVDTEYGHENSVDSLMCLKYISFNNFFKVVDKDDSSYFRVLHAYLDSEHYINPTLVVDFSNQVDPVSAIKKENYEVMVCNKKRSITNIQAGKKTVFIRFKADELKLNNDSCKITIVNVKDIEGNILDKHKTLDLYQFRELFVEDYNKPLTLKDSCYIEFLPLEDNCRSTFNGDEKYWMNTPLNVKINNK